METPFPTKVHSTQNIYFTASTKMLFDDTISKSNSTSKPTMMERTTAYFNATSFTEFGNVTTMPPMQPDLVFRLAAIFVPIFFGVIFFVGIVGNSLVLTVMTKIYKQNGQALNNTNRFIMNLAVSDMLFLIICVPFHATVYTLNEWLFGGFLCIFTRVCEEMTKIASVYTLVALSVDRFLAVVYATSARQIRTRANAIRGLIFIWTSSAGIAAPAIITRVYIIYKGHTLCMPNKLSWKKWYEFCVFLFGYLFPLLTIICCYVGLLYVVCSTARKSSLPRNNRNDSTKKVTRIVIMVVVLFAICWAPHHLVNLWMQFDDNFDYTSKFTFVFRLIAHCMAYANSCINPLVYAFVSKKFREDFKKAFTCQYITEAVGNMKSFSRRMFSTIGETMRQRTRSSYRRNNVPEQPQGESIKGGSQTSEQNTKFSPRSPLMPFASVVAFEKADVNLDVSDEQNTGTDRVYTPSTRSPASERDHNEDEFFDNDIVADAKPESTAV
ncbi:galanin receptor type 1-like [Styela clava]